MLLLRRKTAMTIPKEKVRVAVVQAASVQFKKTETVKKACRLIEEAAAEGAQLILLPEALVPAYPRGFSFGMVVGSRSEEGRALFKRYWDNALSLDDPEMDMLSEAISKAKAFVAIGVIEKDGDFGGGTLYCTLLYFSPHGDLIGKHRKLKPTGAERMIWGEGDGSTMPVFNTPIGDIGGLICWENYMPLARVAMYGKGINVYLAPTADSRDDWQATMKHIALEGRCFVLGCNQYVTKDTYPDDIECREELTIQPDVMCRGGSVIVGPTGKVLAGPLFDREGILYADLDFDEIVKSRLDLDVVGHYGRGDVFSLYVNDLPAPAVVYESEGGGHEHGGCDHEGGGHEHGGCDHEGGDHEHGDCDHGDCDHGDCGKGDVRKGDCRKGDDGNESDGDSDSKWNDNEYSAENDWC
jgi:nitrilase